MTTTTLHAKDGRPVLSDANGYPRVFANRTQAERIAATLRRSGVNAEAYQSFASRRFLVRIVETVN